MADEKVNSGPEEVNAAEPEVTEEATGSSPPEAAVMEPEQPEPAEPTAGAVSYTHLDVYKRQSQDFLRQVGYRNISGILYPGLRHEILNEASRQDIYENILEFAES